MLPRRRSWYNNDDENVNIKSLHNCTAQGIVTTSDDNNEYETCLSHCRSLIYKNTAEVYCIFGRNPRATDQKTEVLVSPKGPLSVAQISPPKGQINRALTLRQNRPGS
jgi:hypothetical protein